MGLWSWNVNSGASLVPNPSHFLSAVLDVLHHCVGDASAAEMGGAGYETNVLCAKKKRQNYSFANKPQHHHILQIDTLYNNIQQTTPRLYRTDTIEH